MLLQRLELEVPLKQVKNYSMYNSLTKGNPSHSATTNFWKRSLLSGVQPSASTPPESSASQEATRNSKCFYVQLFLLSPGGPPKNAVFCRVGVSILQSFTKQILQINCLGHLGLRSDETLSKKHFALS